MFAGFLMFVTLCPRFAAGSARGRPRRGRLFGRGIFAVFDQKFCSICITLNRCAVWMCSRGVHSCIQLFPRSGPGEKEQSAYGLSRCLDP